MVPNLPLRLPLYLAGMNQSFQSPKTSMIHMYLAAFELNAFSVNLVQNCDKVLKNMKVTYWPIYSQILFGPESKVGG